MKEVNTSYYQQLLDKGRYNSSDRNFYQKVLDSIKKQGGKATDRQYNIIQQIKFGKTMYSSKNEHIYNKNNIMNQTTQLRQLIKESIQEYIREVEASGNIAAQEAKVRACEEAIALREKKANMEGLDEAYHDMMDSTKINELKKEIKELQKYKSKAEKVLDKMKMKSEGKTTKKMEDEGMEDGTVDEVNLDEYTDDPASGPQLEENVDKDMYYAMAEQMKDDGMDYDSTVERLEDMGVDDRNAEIIAMNVFKEMEEEMNIYEVLHMQKRAGILSETEYKQKIEILNEDKLVLSNYAKQLYSLFKKAGATPLIVVGKNSTSPDVKNFNISIVVTANDELMVGIKGDKATAEKYSNLVAKQFPDLQLKGDIKIGAGWGGEKDSYADLILIPKTTKKGGDINPNQRPNAPKPTV